MRPALLALLLLAACSPGSPGTVDAHLAPDAAAPADAYADAPTPADASPFDAPPGPPTFCETQWPLASTAAVGHPSERLYVQLRVDGVTPSAGGDPALHVEVGHGLAAAPPSSWTWEGAEWNPDCLSCGDREEWMGTVTPTAAGDYLWAARVAYGASAWVLCDRADGGRLGSTDGFAAADAPTLTASAPGPLRVVTQNLRCLVDSWDARLPVMADGIAAADPELLGVEEACAGGGRDNLTELTAALHDRTGRDYQIVRTVTHASWSGAYEEGVAVVTPYRVAASQIVALPTGLFPRADVITRVITPQGPIVFAATHLDNLSADARVAEADTLLPALTAFVLPGEGVVQVGDFNEAPSDPVHGLFTAAGFVDSWAALHPGEDGFTFPSSAPTIRIDYVWLLAGDSGFAPGAIARILTDPVGGVYGSDHAGLSAVLSR